MANSCRTEVEESEMEGSGCSVDADVTSALGGPGACGPEGKATVVCYVCEYCTFHPGTRHGTYVVMADPVCYAVGSDGVNSIENDC